MLKHIIAPAVALYIAGYGFAVGAILVLEAINGN